MLTPFLVLLLPLVLVLVLVMVLVLLSRPPQRRYGCYGPLGLRFNCINTCWAALAGWLKANQRREAKT